MSPGGFYERSEFAKADDISDSVYTKDRYVLPKNVIATMEDGSKKSKTVMWENEASTKEAGIYEILGNVLGYNEKVKLKLNIKNSFGNSFGNIMNMGWIQETEDFIYYSEVNDGHKLYYMNKKQRKYRSY